MLWRDLKSADPKGLWGFESPSRHHYSMRISRVIDPVNSRERDLIAVHPSISG